jgi:membrane-associated protein
MLFIVEWFDIYLINYNKNMEIFSGENLAILIKTIGLLGLFAIIFAESGLLIGFFLPGDSLLFTAGFLASQGFFDISLLLILSFVAAVLGDSVGYAFGKRVGKKLFTKDDSMFFKKANLKKAEDFYKKYGVKTIVLARFIPIVRTFAPIVAGAGDMHYKTFVSYNVIGGLLWTVGMNLAGYFLGSIIPDVDKYLLPIIFLIIFLSILPPIIEFIKEKRKKKLEPVASQS